ncbi:MAG: C39 family peptidase [Clostridia bacterium]|nr:C39 family peptidase [Clostridia bacterium]
MSYVYVQQNGTLGASIPYPSPAHPSATVATSGCGVCASLMALMNLTTYKVSLKNWTQALRNAGCRDNEGTDMEAVCAYMKKKYGIAYATTTSTDKVVAWLKKGYGVIANVGGEGYFSSAGHFVYVAGLAKNGKLIVLDPYYYADKWTSTVNGINRSKYFTYSASKHEVYCKPSVLGADRAGWFYLLKPTKKVKKKTAAKPKYTDGRYVLLYDMVVRTGPGTDYAAKKVKDLTADGKAHATSKNPNAKAVLKTGTKADATIVEKNGEYWMKIPSGFVCLQKGSKVYARKA